MCGHPVDKIEIIILGGTWDHYPIEYQKEYIRDIYYSANVFSMPEKRERYSLEKEISINETASYKFKYGYLFWEFKKEKRYWEIIRVIIRILFLIAANFSI